MSLTSGVRPRFELRLIEAGKSTQNAYVESFNGKFRDERLPGMPPHGVLGSATEMSRPMWI